MKSHRLPQQTRAQEHHKKQQAKCEAINGMEIEIWGMEEHQRERN
jgi:hypothetical protein